MFTSRVPLGLSLGLCAAAVLAFGCAEGSRSKNNDQQCGDGILQFANGEVCDDGNTADGDGCSSRCQRETPSRESDCTNGFDDDGDGGFDCGDLDCAAEAHCNVQPETACDNGSDDDGDGTTDCADSDCASAPRCGAVELVCDDGFDNDGDGKIDCDDAECDPHAACNAPEVTCGDGADNDFDGFVDCADSDCLAKACGEFGQRCVADACTCPDGAAPETKCADGADNDCDGQADCADSDCTSTAACGVEPESLCSDGLDNDDDGQVDCSDFDCAGLACNATGRVCTASGNCVCNGGAYESACGDAVDNDCDGDMDCADSDCANVPDCVDTETSCTDGRDNDGDGDLDCADADCLGLSCGVNGRQCNAGGSCACPGGTSEFACTNGQDDDCDGATDCMDGDCLNKACGANGRTCNVSGACSCPGGSVETLCRDSLDNDCDGAADCQDGNCATDPFCAGGELDCADTLDNDSDNAADCLDSDCDGQSCGGNGLLCASQLCACPGGATETACGDGQDNDCDAFTDCLDPDCAAAAACLEVCDDGQDNDQDTLVDCADTDCAGQVCDGLGRICAASLCTCPGGTTEAACTDTADNDCDGALDCSDSDCWGDAACADPPCQSDLFMLCNLYHDGNTTGMGADVNGYACTTANESGPEYIYSFLATTNADVTVSLTNPTADLDLVHLTDNGAPGCDPQSCAAASTATSGAESVTFSATAGSFHYFAVDGKNGAAGSYTLDVDCTGGTGCMATWPVDCGFTEFYTTTNPDASSNVDSYSCSMFDDESGPEYTYLFMPSQSGFVDIELVPEPEGIFFPRVPDLDLFILDFNGAVCEGSACLAWGDDGVTNFPVTAGEAYFVVVDGFIGDSGDYTISFNCY